MKYYSDILCKVFDTEGALRDAEKSYENEQLKKKEEANLISKDKKILSDAIDKASIELDRAYEKYDAACDEASKLFEDSDEKIQALKDQISDIINKTNNAVEELMTNADTDVKSANKKKYDAITAFNNKYGPYSKKYTGEEAKKEFDRQSRLFNSWISDWFGF